MHKCLNALFRSFAVLVPPHSPRLPALVLRSLLRAPYELLQVASTRDVSLKTVFLLVLVLAHRVSERHDSSAEVCLFKGWKTISFSLAPDFLGKMQCPGDESLVEFSIPALT